MRSSWNLGKTATMRVPKVLKDDLMEVARHIDDGGEISLDNNKSSKTIVSQGTIDKNNIDIPFSDDLEKPKSILSQDTINNIVEILRYGITSKKDGGIYNSSNASVLKKQVVKVLEILEK